MEAQEFSSQFRKEIGGCKQAIPQEAAVVSSEVESLFCLNGEDEVSEYLQSTNGAATTTESTKDKASTTTSLKSSMPSVAAP